MKASFPALMPGKEAFTAFGAMRGTLMNLTAMRVPLMT